MQKLLEDEEHSGHTLKQQLLELKQQLQDLRQQLLTASASQPASSNRPTMQVSTAMDFEFPLPYCTTVYMTRSGWFHTHLNMTAVHNTPDRNLNFDAVRRSI